MMIRWQVLPNKVPPVHTEVVLLADLPSILPADTRWITPLEREQWLNARAEEFARRSEDSNIK
jgi:hypothetical protein